MMTVVVKVEATLSLLLALLVVLMKLLVLRVRCMSRC
jgi:hypothetical protein